MSIAPCHASAPGQRGEVRQAVEQQHRLHHRAGLAPARPGLEARERRGAQWIGVRDDQLRRQLAAALEHDSRRPAVLDQHAGHRRAGADRDARGLRGGAQRRGHRAHPAARVAPGARHPGGQAELVVEAHERRAGVVGAGECADQPLQGERHAHLLGGDARPARPRSAPPGSPARWPPASAPGREARAAAGARAQPPRPSARPRRRSRRRRRATSRARAAPRCAAAPTR